ncbi:MAG: protease pro-enzyme activation domain-containing protein [Candidatus Dormibacteria bacterium]
MSRDMPSHQSVLPGSGPPRGGGWLRRGHLPPDHRLGITVYLRERPDGDALGERVDRVRTGREGQRRLSYKQLAAHHGPSPGDLAAVRRFAADHNLTPGGLNAASCGLELSGQAGDLERALGIELSEHVLPHAVRDGHIPAHRSHDGPLSVPAPLEGVVLAVAGLNDRPLARAHFQVAARTDPAAGYGAEAVAEAYGVPRGSSAEGQTVGVIALGGGYTRRDLDTFCSRRSPAIAVPSLRDISVHGAVNAPTNGGDPLTADGEVALDIETVAAVAPGAAIRVYFAPNTDRGFVDGVARAIADGCSVVSISWGAPEALWPFSSMVAFDRTCQSAVALGIPVFCASGDSGSCDGLYDTRSHADFPASSPHTVACGGTTLPDLDRRRETAWNDLADGGGAGGGGVSDAWPMPDYQTKAHPPVSVNDGRRRRTLPDLAANAAPRTGYRVRVGGRWTVIGGTSAVAPLMAGMTALMNAHLSSRRPGARMGDFHAALYSRFARTGAMHDIADGSTNGGHYFARPGYDAVTGWGSPDYSAMLKICLEDVEGAAPEARRAGQPATLAL